MNVATQPQSPKPMSSALLPVRHLGHVFAVQGPDPITSLVRITSTGTACDCPWFAAHRKPCVHIALAAKAEPGP